MLYSNNGLNNQLKSLNFGTRLFGIIPDQLAIPCDAFSVAMMQIKNIQAMNIEKFAQVVTNIEPMVGASDVGMIVAPINLDVARSALTILAKGTGTNGKFTTCDFFGAMTNLRYDLKNLLSLIKSLNTTSLSSIYDGMYSVITGAGPYDTALAPYITSANAAIATLKTNHLEL